MNRGSLFLVFAIFVASASGRAQEANTPSPDWSHESEASLVRVAGNTRSESYSVKQKTELVADANKYVLTGRYLDANAASVQTAHSWDLSLRYERAISDRWSAFAQQGAESDPFAGYVQRDGTDLGAKYFLSKEEDAQTFVELGGRFLRTIPVGTRAETTDQAGRFYLETFRQFNGQLSGKYWVEYIQSTRDPEIYYVNYEPSLTAMMTKIFSMKIAYRVKIHNQLSSPTEQKEDSTFTTSIVAKF